MPEVLLAARVVIAVVLGIAGASKVRDPLSLAVAAEDLGVRARPARVVGNVLPTVELSLAALLLIGSTAWLAAAGALVLFVAFTALVARNLAGGNRPDCNCFGELHSAPIGPATLARNIALTAAAAFVVIAGVHDAGPGLLAWAVESVGWGGVAAATAVVVVGAGAYLLGRRRGAPPQPARQPSLPRGAVAPEFSLTDLTGTPRTLRDLRAAGRDVIVLFVDPGCGPCRRLLPEIPRWTQVADATVAVLAAGDRDRVAEMADEHDLDGILLYDDERAISNAWGNRGTPGAVIVGADGRTATDMVTGAPAIRDLVAKYASVRTTAPLAVEAPAVGDPAPALVLPGREGEDVNLGTYSGTLTVVVFVGAASPDTAAVVANLPGDDAAYSALVVVLGDESAMQTVRTNAAVVADATRMTALAYGVTSTPAAVLVDAQLRIAAPPVFGADAIAALTARAGALGAVAASLRKA